MDSSNINKNFFPTVKKSITDFLYEEEANISRSKMLSLGSLMIIVSVLMMSEEVFAAHRSHSSHSSHRSHSSHSSHTSHTSSTHSSHASSSGGNVVYPTPAPVSTPKLTPTPTPAPTPTPTPLPEIQIPQIPQDTPVIK